jgi:hypothetical protein
MWYTVRMNLENQQFGRLAVLSRAESRITKGGNVLTRWLCLCSCGAEKVILTSSLLQGKTRSCGCLHKETSRQSGLLNRKHGGYSKNTSTDDQIKHQALVNIRERSRRHGYESDLTVEDLPVLTNVCPVLGTRYQKGTLKNKDASPSVDRKNPNLPYLKKYADNLVFISHKANRLKSNATVEDLEKIINYIRGR